jgi:hypothetical protein
MVALCRKRLTFLSRILDYNEKNVQISRKHTNICQLRYRILFPGVVQLVILNLTHFDFSEAPLLFRSLSHHFFTYLPVLMIQSSRCAKQDMPIYRPDNLSCVM